MYIGLLQCVCQFARSCHRYSRLDLHQTRSNISATRIGWPAAFGDVHKRRRNFFGHFWHPLPHIRILTLIHLTFIYNILQHFFLRHCSIGQAIKRQLRIIRNKFQMRNVFGVEFNLEQSKTLPIILFTITYHRLAK